jgi:PKD repeat protein
MLLPFGAVLQAAPVFSAPGFVDETLHTGAGVISMAFDSSGRLWACEKQGRVLVFPPNPLPASSFAYSYYENSGAAWTVLPDFSTLTPAKTGTVSSFTLDPRDKEDQFAFVYTGQITTATAGDYTFYTASDDGSRLFIDGALVVDNDGSHGANEKSGVATLTAGAHQIRVEYFENGGGQSLDVNYSGPGVPKGPVAQGPFEQPTVFADISSQVNTDAERGLLGLTLDPDFANNRHLYILFSTSIDQKIERLTADESFSALVPGSEAMLIRGLPNSNNVHKAGDLHFSPQDPNSLYVVIGDDGDRTLVGNLDLWNGKILRIDSSSGKGVPGNPYYGGDGSSVRSHIWAARFRNPFRFTFDPATPIADVVYVSENGDGTDRLVRISKGADGGWDDQFTTSSTDGKRTVLETSDPSKTGIAILRSGPFAPDGVPVLYNSRYGGGDRNEVRRWQLTGANLDTLTPIAADNGAAFYSGFTDHQIVSFTPGPDGSLYYSDSGQGPSTDNQRIGRLRFVGGTAPTANFTVDVANGPAPLPVVFTDASSAPDSSIGSRSWSFGDGATSTATSPSHTYARPGVYTVSLTVTNAQGLAQTKQSTVTVYQETGISLSGDIFDGRTLAAPAFATATDLRFYQADGTTPLAVTGGTGTNQNILAIAAGGQISLNFTARITGPGMVVSAGESGAGGVQAAFAGAGLSVSSASQAASVEFRLSDTMLRGRVVDTRGAPARVDVGVSRNGEGNPYAFVGGRDFLAGSGHSASGINHRTVPDALGYYHVPLLTGDGGGVFSLDTTADTLVATDGSIKVAVTVPAGAVAVKNLTIGLYDGGTDEADLSGIAVTPEVDFASRIQTIFTTSCVACHDGIATNSAGLDLREGHSLAALIGVGSDEAPGVKRVEAGSPARSYLMEKISAAQPQSGTSMRPGDPMPLAQQALIRDWISQLAPPTSDPFAAWSSLHFGDLANSPDAQPGADFDHDGVANLLEYILGTDPTLSQADRGYSVDRDESEHLRFHFTHPLEMPGITLRIAASDSLDPASWTELATKSGSGEWTTAAGVSVSDDAATGVVVVIDSETPATRPVRFLRLEATRAE